MSLGIMLLTWSGKTSTGPERMVLHTAAVKVLQSGTSTNKVYFTHPICDGLLTNKGRGSLGRFSGTIFRADLDGADGIPRMVEFLVPFGAEHIVLEPEYEGLSVTPLETEDGVVPHGEVVAGDDRAAIHTLN